MKRWLIIALISVGLICIVLLAGLISLGSKLDNEMALRFDLEDTLSELRDENISFQDRIKNISSELEKNKVKVTEFGENLAQEQSLNASLKSEIDRLTTLNFDLNVKNAELASKLDGLQQEQRVSSQADTGSTLSSVTAEQVTIQGQ